VVVEVQELVLSSSLARRNGRAEQRRDHGQQSREQPRIAPRFCLFIGASSGSPRD